MRSVSYLLALAAATLLAAAAHAAPEQELTPAEIQHLRGVLDAEHPQFGDVRLPGPDVTLHLRRDFYFLDAAEAKQVLVEWGNPPEKADGVLGMVFPAGKTFVDGAWGAVLTYEASGYVDDKDAERTDYDKMLADTQAGEDEDNARRQKQGFTTMHMVGWAQPPSYDREHHYLIWAQNLKLGDQAENALNYDVRVLGRKGVLSMNMVSDMSKLATIRSEANQLAATASFNPGSAYSDYVKGHDKAADYGVAGLVAGGLGVAAAQKLGLLAIVLAFLKKGAVLVVAGGAAVARWGRKLIGRPKREPTKLDPPDEEDAA